MFPIMVEAEQVMDFPNRVEEGVMVFFHDTCHIVISIMSLSQYGNKAAIWYVLFYGD